MTGRFILKDIYGEKKSYVSFNFNFFIFNGMLFRGYKYRNRQLKLEFPFSHIFLR